jgi:carboxypeptidase Taq
MEPQVTYTDLCETLKSIHDLQGAQAILSWDQETTMPPKAAKSRARQLGALSALIHQQSTSKALGSLLDNVPEDDLDDVAKVNLSEARRSFERSLKVPGSLVRELTETCSLANEAWQKAKSEDKVSIFLPWLKKVVDLKRQEIEHRAPGAHVYDEMLDDYERGLTEEQVAERFADLKTWLIPFVKELSEAPKQPDLSLLKRPFEVSRQESFGLETIKLMGFDFDAGRFDTSAHPFCGGVGPFDVRITTRYLEDEVLSSFFSFVHEGGHALYEQGLNPEHLGLPVCGAASMAFHESQSRLWENCVARSKSFWEFMFPRFVKHFGEPARDLEFEPFYHAVNAVAPSMVRVESDEVTYNLHVILRFEIERDLFAGRLQVEDLEEAWNARMVEYMGLEPRFPSEGVLQDIHWAFGGFGYFPTYTYGNLYSAQIFATVQKELPDLDQQIRRGHLSPLREWLREKIHKVGKLKAPGELIQEISGEPLHQRFLVNYLEEKYRPLYGLNTA